MSEPTPSSTPPERPAGEAPSEPVTGPIQPVAPPQYGPPPGYAPPPQHAQKQSRVPLIAAWVGIAAGAVFIVAIIFGTGFMLGAHSGQHGGSDRGDAMARRDGPPPQVFPMGPMLRPGPGFVFPGGPGGEFAPGGPGGVFAPGGPGGSFGPDGPRGSGQSPSTLPSPPR